MMSRRRKFSFSERRHIMNSEQVKMINTEFDLQSMKKVH